MKNRAVIGFVFVLAASVAAPLAPAEAEVHPNQSHELSIDEQATSGLSSSPKSSPAGGLQEAPSPIVVEVAPLLAPGPDGELPVGLEEDMEAHLDYIRAIAAAAEASRIGEPPQNYAAAYSGMVASYNSTYSAPSQVRTVVDAAVIQWDSVLATNPSGPIVVEVFWSDLGNSSLLGYAGPDGMFFGGELPSDTLYPAALTNTLLGLDANGASRPEIQVVLNAELLANNRWYLGASGNPAGNQIDLYSVVLHEIGHGLGFLGSASVPEGHSQPQLHSPPYIYDRNASHNYTPIVDFANPVAALLSNDMRAAISQGMDYKLYAPPSWAQGSSFSHFDEQAYPAGSPGALMTPMLSSGEVARILDGPTLGLMSQAGWPMAADVITPTITTVSPSLTSAVVSWTHNLGLAGLAADAYLVEAFRDGTIQAASVTVAGSETTATLQSLSPGVSYTVKVTPIAASGYGTPATSSVQLQSSGAPADPTDWPSYIRNLPLDGQINRLYQAYFLRLADESGFGYWIGRRAQWTPLEEISSAFAASAEFQARYGSLTDEAFIDLVYANVLDRAADQAGRSYWLSELQNGKSRGEVMIGFAESAEYVARTGTAAATSTAEASIRRLYEAFYLRAPDAGGLAYWMDQAANGVALKSIASAFAQSAEFQDRYGSVTDQQFIELVYNNVLGRSPDIGGMSYWLGQMQDGVDRGTVMVGFSESVEFITATGTIP